LENLYKTVQNFPAYVSVGTYGGVGKFDHQAAESRYAKNKNSFGGVVKDARDGYRVKRQKEILGTNDRVSPDSEGAQDGVIEDKEKPKRKKSEVNTSIGKHPIGEPQEKGNFFFSAIPTLVFFDQFARLAGIFGHAEPYFGYGEQCEQHHECREYKVGYGNFFIKRHPQKAIRDNSSVYDKENTQQSVRGSCRPPYFRTSFLKINQVRAYFQDFFFIFVHTTPPFKEK